MSREELFGKKFVRKKLFGDELCGKELLGEEKLFSGRTERKRTVP
jgi:hypothetical protein